MLSHLERGGRVKDVRGQSTLKDFGDNKDEITREWRTILNAELHALYSSHYLRRNLKSRRLRKAGLVTRMEKSRNAYLVLVGRPEGKRPLGSREADGRTILKWIYGIWIVLLGTG